MYIIVNVIQICCKQVLQTLETFFCLGRYVKYTTTLNVIGVALCFTVYSLILFSVTSV